MNCSIQIQRKCKMANLPASLRVMVDSYKLEFLGDLLSRLGGNEQKSVRFPFYHTVARLVRNYTTVELVDKKMISLEYDSENHPYGVIRDNHDLVEIRHFLRQLERDDTKTVAERVVNVLRHGVLHSLEVKYGSNDTMHVHYPTLSVETITAATKMIMEKFPVQIEVIVLNTYAVNLKVTGNLLSIFE